MPSEPPVLARPAVIAAFVGFPVALAAADLVAPSFAHGSALAAAVAAHPSRTWLFVGLRLAVAFLMLAAAGVVWLIARERRRGRVVAGVAAVLAVLGALGQAQDAAYQLFVLSLRDRSAAEAGGMLTRLDTLAAPLELPLLLAFALSLPLLLVAAYRAGAARIWAVGAAVAAFLVHFAPGAVPSRAADLLLLVAFVGATVTAGTATAVSGAPATAAHPSRVGG